MRHNVQKGTFGYMGRQRKRALLRTVLLFAVSLALYLAGYLSTGSNQNLLTIVAVLGCLPACKSAVNAIMLYRYHGCPAEAAALLQGQGEGCSILWDMVFTSYEKTFEVNHLALSGKELAGYASNPSCDCAACEKHLRAMLSQNGLGGVNVKIFSQLSNYQNRLAQLSGRSEGADARDEGEDRDRQERILALLRAISL